MAASCNPAPSLFRKVDNALEKPLSQAIRSPGKDSVDLAYPWGSVSAAYSKKGENGIGMRIVITNSSKDAIPDLSLRLLELGFPNVPQGNTLEAGMFGFGFKNKPAQIGTEPLLADPEFVVQSFESTMGAATILNLWSVFSTRRIVQPTPAIHS
jgi:hypothetical protein